MPAKIWAMYSYKGGAGRTVCTANVASILAMEHGKRVVCIDMDMEGAGLSVVFGIQDRLNEKGRKCVQDIFGVERMKSPEDFQSAWWPQIHIDLGAELRLDGMAGKLLVVPAAFAARMVEWTDQVEHVMLQFLRNIRDLVQPDIILIDSASGLQDWACLTMECSDSMALFFRWNKQFLEGTIRVVNFIINNEIFANDILLVPSAVPEIAESEDRYQAILEASTTRLDMETGVAKNPKLSRLTGIREAVGLKWEERLLNLADDREPDEDAALEDLRALATRMSRQEE